jgi:hypothetical protein
VGKTGLSPLRVSDELMTECEIISQLLLFDHQSVKKNAFIRLQSQPQMGWIMDILVILTGHALLSFLPNILPQYNSFLVAFKHGFLNYGMARV